MRPCVSTKAGRRAGTRTNELAPEVRARRVLAHARAGGGGAELRARAAQAEVERVVELAVLLQQVWYQSAMQYVSSRARPHAPLKSERSAHVAGPTLTLMRGGGARTSDVYPAGAMCASSAASDAVISSLAPRHGA
jgi:hypothetical protein